MSTKDISRFLHQPQKHYSGVRMQQGRVLLDSDFNEGALLHEDDKRRAIIDIVGPSGSPDTGFAIGLFDLSTTTPTVTPFPSAAVAATPISFNGAANTPVVPYGINVGTIYVGGMRFELSVPEHIALQNDFLQATADVMPTAVADPAFDTPFVHVLYLNAWEQCVTAVEDEEFLEQALGGPDTSVRVRRMRRVELAQLDSSPGGFDCVPSWNQVISLLEDNATFDRATSELVSNGRLQITFQEGPQSDNCAPCDPSPTGQFLGAENQAIRVMLTSPDTYVWAIDNAAPLYRVQVTGVDVETDVPTVTMLTPPKDAEHFPQANMVVEILPWSAVFDNGERAATEIGVFARVAVGFNADDRTFTLVREGERIHAIRDLVHKWDSKHPHPSSLAVGSGATRVFYARFWHMASQDGHDVEISTSEIVDGQPRPLGRTGLVPNFKAAGRAGDFWTAAARPQTPTQIIPRELHEDVNGIPPHGPRHFFAPLALVQGDVLTNGTITVSSVLDLRPHLRRTTDIGCCTLTVGDGVCSTGEFTKVQDAINALPPSGGKICIRPGTYEETIVINGRDDIILEGCGPKTVLRAEPFDSPPLPALAITRSRGITVRSLAVEARLSTAIQVFRSTPVRLEDLDVGIFQGGDAIDPDVENASEPLVFAHESSDLTVTSVHFGPSRRTGLSLSIVAGATFEKLTVDGVPSGDTVPMDALVQIELSNNVVLRDSHLTPFGQVGVLLNGNPTPLAEPLTGSNRDVVLERLVIAAGPHPAETNELGGQVQSRSAIDVQGGERIRIANCTCTIDPSLSEHAVVVVEGTDIDVDDNRIECFIPVDSSPDDGFPPPQVASWGGLQVRGQSFNVKVRRNHILGGLGHGITLGSAVWAPAAQPDQSVRFGAGHGQIVEHSLIDDPSAFIFRIRGAPLADAVNVARDQGFLKDLLISGNHIELMSNNGISVLTQFWNQTDEDFIEVRNALIEGNRIEDNLRDTAVNDIGLLADSIPTTGTVFDFEKGQGPSTNFAATDLRVLQQGGIVLAAATGRLDVHDNVIANNGASPTRTDEGTGAIIPNEVPVSGLFVLVGDEIVIADNRIVGNGPAMTAISEGGATFLAAGIRAGIAVMLAGVGRATRNVFFDVRSNPTLEDASGSSLRVINNTVMQPEGRALFVTGTGPLVVEGNFLSSTGNHGAVTQEDQLAIGDVVLVQNLGQPWEASDFNNVPSGTVMPFPTRDYLTSAGNTTTPSPLVLFFVGDGGQVQFSNNQVVYDWLVRQLPESPTVFTLSTNGFRLSFYSVAILSLDHATVSNNQMAMRVRFDPDVEQTGLNLQLVSHLVVAGATVDVRGNRVAESADDSVLSILTMGLLLNTTSFNQGTHCTGAFVANSLALPGSSGPFHAVDHNLTLLIPNGNTLEACVPVANTFLSTATTFFNLMTAIGDRAPRPNTTQEES